MTTTRRTHPRRHAIPALALALTLGTTLTSCGEASSPGASAPTTSDDATTTSEDPMDPSQLTPITPQPEPVTPGDQGALPTGEVPPGIADRADVQAAVAAEAQRRGVDASAVTVAGYAEVTWSDGSLGCPQPGMMYTQALVPGHQLVLEVDGELVSYHAAQGKPFTYCASPVPPTPGSQNR